MQHTPRPARPQQAHVPLHCHKNTGRTGHWDAKQAPWSLGQDQALKGSKLAAASNCTHHQPPRWARTADAHYAEVASI